MKNFAVWNTILDSNSVNDIYNNGNFVSLAENFGNYAESSNLKIHCDFTTGSVNDLTGNHSNPTLISNASIVNTSSDFIGLVQASQSSIAEVDSGGVSSPMSSFLQVLVVILVLTQLYHLEVMVKYEEMVYIEKIVLIIL